MPERPRLMARRRVSALTAGAVLAVALTVAGCGSDGPATTGAAASSATRAANGTNAMSTVVSGAAATTFVDSSGSTPAYVFLDATWCTQQCAALRSQVASHLRRFPSQNAQTRRVDLDEAAALAERFSVTSVPTLLRVEGGKVTQRRMGAYRMTDSGGYEAGGVYQFYMG